MEFLEKLGIKISNKSIKEEIYEECNRLNLNKKETEIVYEYYKNNKKEFMINPKAFFCTEKIVDIIIKKLILVC